MYKCTEYTKTKVKRLDMSVDYEHNISHIRVTKEYFRKRNNREFTIHFAIGYKEEKHGKNQMGNCRNRIYRQ